ncbi:MAG: hypothetical protein RMK81_11240 [Geminicoccaceae bacterium]|nr:hypothetical protein [Gammaproteobacteria bacterium]MDW8370837.1 hypothetical protein [Geminicoccaceae bacterium]
MAYKIEGGAPWDYVLTPEEIYEEERLFAEDPEAQGNRPWIASHPLFYPGEDRSWSFEHALHTAYRFYRLSEAEREKIYARIAQYVDAEGMAALREASEKLLRAYAEREARGELPKRREPRV